MSLRVDSLPLDAKLILQWGSCMGISFDLAVVARAMNMNINAVIKSTQVAIDFGMITIVKDMMQFTHDRVREAVYGSIYILTNLRKSRSVAPGARKAFC